MWQLWGADTDVRGALLQEEVLGDDAMLKSVVHAEACLRVIYDRFAKLRLQQSEGRSKT
jgi:hypothetical protein